MNLSHNISNIAGKESRAPRFFPSENERRNQLIEVFKTDTKNLTKEKAQKFLVGAGIFTKSGNLHKRYKGICIPKDMG